MPSVDQRIATIRELLRHPRLVGPEGVPEGASERELDAFEASERLALPSALRDWYADVNAAFCGSQVFVGLPTAPRGVLYRHSYYAHEPKFRAQNWIEIAHDGCGSHYLVDLADLQNPDAPVFFSDHADVSSATRQRRKTYCAASGIWTFTELFLRRELFHVGVRSDLAIGWEWPFDREKTLEADHSLLSVKNIPLPWDT